MVRGLVLSFEFLLPFSNSISGIFVSDVAVMFMLLAPVVQRVDSAIHRINHYPVEKY